MEQAKKTRKSNTNYVVCDLDILCYSINGQEVWSKIMKKNKHVGGYKKRSLGYISCPGCLYNKKHVSAPFFPFFNLGAIYLSGM